MDFSFKWRNNSGNMRNSMGLNTMNDVYLHDHQKYESVDLSEILLKNSEVNHSVNFEEQKPKKTATVNPPSEPKKINIFEKKF